ncbi:MAG: sigma 54-dependent Fis family transcriptional regulator [Deltaproteobacteria bacterium]|jgi:DNA-binding NtrC family response regulator|nr:sigma 54-dependent Fis family transcriptional regulator [Deltaproteobacteria bacterium]
MAEDGTRTQLALTPLSRPRRMTVRSLELEITQGTEPSRRHGPLTPPIRVGSAEGNEVILTDPTVSRFHLSIEGDPLGLRVVDAGSTNGSFLGAVRIKDAYWPEGTPLRLGQTSLSWRAHGEDQPVELSAEPRLGALLGDSAVMRALFSTLRRLAASPVAVHLQGETGSGKELAARALHEEGPRRAGPLVVFDCGAVAPTLIESELFGHERGAFTGAETAREGALARANGGTLFLDEVGELPLTVQPKLLRALESGRYRTLGGAVEQLTQFRLVSATHRDLRRMVNEGTFREDLYFRLAVVPLKIPPLRERPEDLILLARFFLRQALGVAEAPPLSEETQRVLTARDWPGNVRELKNAIERAVALGEPEAVESGQLQDALRTLEPLARRGDPTSLPLEEAKRRFEREYLVRLLARLPDKVLAASAAELHPKSLERLIRRHQLKGGADGPT